ncbi:phosphatase PAP2 family protein [Citricoccus sp. SGAir0253]|uniref:phosphatase PAP2 family protein n=1 Tax=Citricoccus sp. SGAir0253 TaxID=2567881 RepID=UPI0010CD4343|nr:phosphatase PAP2 family protein [Citricoccus sp. SGAir0253]QCU77393.1 phosphatase PAP2 family protein [Citricoccus sp. SGAir0253]
MSSAVRPGPRSPARSPARHPAAWLLAMAGSAALLLGLFRVFVTTSTGQLTEYLALESATHRLEGMRGPVLAVLDRLPEIVGVLGAVAFLALAVWRRRWLASAVAAAGFAAANLTTQLLKSVVLVRPDLDNGVPYYTGNSMPSGHTTFAAAAAVAVFLLVAPRWRPLTAALGAVFATAVGAGTFVEAWHRPADMAAAYLVAAFWGFAAGFVVLRTGADWNTRGRATARHPHPGGHPGWEVALWTGGTAALLGAGAAFAAAGGAAGPSADPAAASGGHFVAGLLFTVGPGLLVFAVLAGFFRWQSGRRS